MGLFSFLRKNTSDSDTDDGGFYSRAEEESVAVRSRGKRKQSAGKDAGPKPVDPVLPEKKRARRRLVGSIALVMGLIIGLPMMLDSKPKPVADDIVIQIPSKDAPENRARIRRPAPSSSVAPKGLDPTEEVIEMPMPGKPSSLSATAPNAGRDTEPTVVASAPKAVEKPQPKLAPTIDKVSLTSPSKTDPPTRGDAKNGSVKSMSAEPAGKDTDASRAASILEGKSPSAKPDNRKDAEEKKSEKVVLQIAALASAQKASELQNKLSSAGIRSHSQKVSTGAGERIRIRVGPYSSSEEANKVRARLTALGLNGTVVSN